MFIFLIYYINKYKSDDYKLSAVKYYLKHNDSMDKVCNIFDCKKSTLKGWVDRYKNTKNVLKVVVVKEHPNKKKNKDELRLIHGLLLL